MTLTTRIFRLFVSSTFSDFIAEREALQKVVFPKLEDYCARRGARFQAVDLRWGITEEAQREHDTMRICLEEVRRCQQLSPRPNFAVLLGDRYGWEPVPARIPQDHWMRLHAASSPADWQLIEASYRLDKNAIPPMYCLRERTADQDAFQREAALLQALRRSARGFRGSARLPYFASATHQEIALGALSRRDESGENLEPEQHVHVYVRHLERLPQDESAKDFIDWDPIKAEMVPGARDRLRGLESQLRTQLGDHVHDLHTTWSRQGRNGAVNKAYLKRFCDAFLEHQKQLIDAELASLERIDERQQREQAHQDFGAERARVFAGRSALLAKIARHTEQRPKGKGTRLGNNRAPNTPLILLGGGGSGKSALLARAAQDDIREAKRSGAIILQRYIGGVPGTESLFALLSALSADIASLYGQDPPQVPENAKELVEGFQASLSLARIERPLVLYLDALDQLDDGDSAWMLEWLPKELPTNVRVVASARTNTSVEQSARRRYPKSLIEVSPMKPTEGRAMLEAWLADKRAAWFNAGIAPSIGRSLTPQQKQAVLTASNGSALWLKLAYEEAATWTSWNPPRKLPNTVEGLIEDLIDCRLIKQENHPKVFTERALAYLTAGRFGLSESELSRALGTDPAVRAEFQENEKTQRKWDDARALPPILWSRLFFDLQAYLGVAQVDGTLLMRWFHREFAEVLKARYLVSLEQRKAIHGALANTFLNLEREFRPEETNDDALFRLTDVSGKQGSAALRRVMEQPWQLAQAGRHEDLQDLLTDFGFCLGKCAANGNALLDLIQMFRQERTSHRGAALEAWIDCITVNAHLLRRGSVRWPAHRIFLQVAVEHADDSAITLAAQEWLERGQCDWVWVRQTNREKLFRPSPLLAVMEGHTSSVKGVLILSGGRVLSWSEDTTLRLWDGMSGGSLAVMEGHTGPVWGADVLPDGRVLSWSEDGTLRLWDPACGTALSMFEGHTAPIACCRSMTDGRALSWDTDGTLRLWDVRSGKPLAVMEGHAGAVWGTQVLPDGQVLSWSEDTMLRLWDEESGEPLAVMEGHAGPVWGADILPDGRVLSWGKDTTLRLWDGESGEPLAVMEGHTGPVFGAQALPDSRMLSWSEDNSLRLWDGRKGASLLVMDHQDLKGAQVLPDGRALSWSRDGLMRLWDLESCTPVTEMDAKKNGVYWGHDAEVQVVPDGRALSWSLDGTLHIWDVQAGNLLSMLEGRAGPVVGGRLLPNGRVLSWSDDRALALWDGQNGTLLGLMEGHTDGVYGVELMADDRVLSWSSDGTLCVWDVGVDRSWTTMEGHADLILGAQTLADGRVLSWCEDGSLRFWDGWTGAHLVTFEGHGMRVFGAQVLGDGRVLSWANDGTLCLWDGQSGDRLAVMMHSAPVVDAQVLSDGRILSLSDDGTLGIWDGLSGELLATMEGHTQPVHGACVMADGRVLSWSGDSTLRLWDGQSGGLLAVLEGHRRAVEGAVVLPDERVLSWSGDGTLRIWHGQTGVPLAVLQGHSSSVTGVDVAHDGRLLSWSDDGTLRLWSGQNGANLAVMEGPFNQFGGAKILSDGRILSWWSADGSLSLRDGQTGEPLKVIPPDWVWTAAHPVPWLEMDSVGGARRLGSVWVSTSEKGNDLRVAERNDAFRAQWSGPNFVDAAVIGVSGGSLVFTTGRFLRWLQVMHGDTPIAV